MLLLTRRIKEKLTIGDDIEITLIWIKNKKIKIKVYNKRNKSTNLEILVLKKIFELTKDVSIIITYLSRSQATFGIQAPKEISIHRYEIYLKILAGIPISG